MHDPLVTQSQRTPWNLLVTASLIAALLAPLPVIAARAQEAEIPPAQEPQEEPPEVAFREEIKVRLVTLPVLARDRQGRPVTDLEAAEVEVREGRRRRFPAAFLTPFFETPEERQDLPAVRLISDLPGGPRGVTKPTAREPRYLLLLVDLENDPPVQKRTVMEALVELVERDLDPSFKVGLMSYDGELELQAPFTHERHAVVQALHRVYAERSARPRITLELRMAQLLQTLETCEDPAGSSHFDPVADMSCLRASVLEYADQMRPQANAFLDALEGVIQYLSGLEGHKAVLALSGGTAMEVTKEATEAMRALFGPREQIAQLELSLATGEGVRSRLEQLIELAFHHDVSLSFLDRSSAPSDFSARRTRLLQPGYRPMLTAHQMAQQDLAEIAGATGGVFVANTRVDEGLRQALNLIEGGYYVGFYLDDDEPLTPERLGRMRVRSSRRGVTLQHRRAYEGGRRSAGSNPAGTVRGEIQVGRPVRREAEGILGDFIPLELVVEPRDLGYEETAELAAATFTVHLMLRTDDGTLLADSYHFLTHTYPLRLWSTGEIEPPTFTAWAELPAGDYSVEAIVSVPQLGRRGHFRRDVDVRSSRGDEASETDSSSENDPESPAPAGSGADRDGVVPPT